MAKKRTKPLLFQFEGEEATFDMVKVDRSKLYGFKELEVTDDDGRVCELATLAEDGRTIIGKGGTGIGYLSADGKWADKTQLKPVDIEGEEIVPVGSSFGSAIPLLQQITSQEFLNYNIRLCYLMEPGSEHELLMKALSEGAIFSFPYSYRGGLVADTGFLLMNAANEVFFLVGDLTSAEFIGLQQAAVATTEEDDDESGTDNLMDFGMI